METRRTYVAVVEPLASRNTQILRTKTNDTHDDKWEEYNGRLYLGVYVGDYDSVLSEVADEFGINEENIALIDTDSDCCVL